MEEVHYIKTSSIYWSHTDRNNLPGEIVDLETKSSKYLELWLTQARIIQQVYQTESKNIVKDDNDNFNKYHMQHFCAATTFYDAPPSEAELDTLRSSNITSSKNKRKNNTGPIIPQVGTIIGESDNNIIPGISTQLSTSTRKSRTIITNNSSDTSTSTSTRYNKNKAAQARKPNTSSYLPSGVSKAREKAKAIKQRIIKSTRQIRERISTSTNIISVSAQSSDPVRRMVLLVSNITSITSGVLRTFTNHTTEARSIQTIINRTKRKTVTRVNNDSNLVTTNISITVNTGTSNENTETDAPYNSNTGVRDEITGRRRSIRLSIEKKKILERTGWRAF